MEEQARLFNLQYAVYTVAFIVVSSTLLAYLARFAARLRGLSETEQRKVFWGFLFAGPWIVGFLIFVLGPALASLYYSFTDYQIGSKLEWIGLDNYRTMLLNQGRQGRLFNKAMLNSFYYALIGVPLQITAALVMALLLNNEIRGIRAFRMIFYMPVILAGGPAILLAWRYMLSSNGGFVNEMLRKFAALFVGFDYLYRGFIYVMEAFNGFYTGLTTGDPLGPITFVFPGIIAILLLGLLAVGDWSEGKRIQAWRSAQIIGIAVVYRLIAKGLMASPIDPSWVYFLGITLLITTLTTAWQKLSHIRLIQAAGLGTLIVVAVAALEHADSDLAGVEARRYLVPLALVAAPLIGSLFGRWNRQKYLALSGCVTALSLILLARLASGQLDGHHLNVVTHYLTFGSTLEHVDDLNYLDKVYPASLLSSLWFYGLTVAVVLGVAILNTTYPRARRALTYSALVFFALFTVGAFLDGRTYFQAFADIAAAAGKPVYHFALFRQATAHFPGHDRVPLWMNSELWSKPSLILITMWSSGTGMLIFLAALKSVPRAMYEAAEVDGANTFQRFWKITLPLISPAMFYNVVIGMIAALQTFENVYILQTPLTIDSLQSAAFLLYSRTFTELHIGEGAAMSWILVIIIVTLTVLQFRFSRSWVHYEA
jgi:ABC-type sugar transport system permease subunit